MSFEYKPYSKEQQIGKPKIKKKRYPEKKKKKRNPLKQEIYKGRVIPKKSKRGRISSNEYAEAQRKHGDCCYVCGTTINIEAHHIRFRSNSGRGNWRNIRFLCDKHHRGSYSPHQNEDLRKELEKLHESLYGPYYYCDKYDLFKLGLIDNTTDSAYEKFMSLEELKCQNNGAQTIG
ncbi:hypothetical protein J6TS2_50710 [Heyndrickxia sporothermodurans]|nr:hypothetical protein J6TS2_50710 [Heyndrickxia sporothermodurans]